MIPSAGQQAADEYSGDRAIHKMYIHSLELL